MHHFLEFSFFSKRKLFFSVEKVNSLKVTGGISLFKNKWGLDIGNIADAFLPKNFYKIKTTLKRVVKMVNHYQKNNQKYHNHNLEDTFSFHNFLYLVEPFLPNAPYISQENLLKHIHLIEFLC